MISSRMALTDEEITSRMMNFHNDFQKAWGNSDVEKMVSMYHPEATLIAKGFWAARGRTEIGKKLEEMLQNKSEVKYTFDVKLATENGEYLFQKGRFEPLNGSGIVGQFETIFQRQNDGRYLVYHDIFTFQ